MGFPVVALPAPAGAPRVPHGGVRPVVALAGLLALAGAQAQGPAAKTAAAGEAITEAVTEVKPGDTFSALAARHTGSLRSWRQLYRPQLSGLANPDRIQVGMRFALASDAQGRYLRLVAGPGGAAGHGAAAVPVPVPVSSGGSAPPPAAAQPPAPAPVLPAPPVAAAAAGELVVGVLPNIAPATLLAQYENLRRFLEKQNGGTRVRVVVPASFKVFFDAMMAGEYDLAVAAPHLARVAQADRSLVPLGMYEPRINALFVAPVDSPIVGAREVRNKAVGFANPQSLVAMYGLNWLKGLGLEPGKDFEVKAARSDLGVGRMMLTGEAVAAVMSNGELRALPPDESSRLRIVEVFTRIPNFILMAHPARLDRERMARLKAQLRAFPSDKDDGAEFMRATGLSGVAEVEEAQMRELDAFAPQTRRAMGVLK